MGDIERKRDIYDINKISYILMLSITYYIFFKL